MDKSEYRKRTAGPDCALHRLLEGLEKGVRSTAKLNRAARDFGHRSSNERELELASLSNTTL